MKPKIAANWEPIDILFIRKNFPVMTWAQLLYAINEIRPASQQVELSALRHQVRRMGLSKNILIHWSKQDINFLQKNYTKIGNVEMAGILNEKHRTFRVINGKKTFRTFTKKHIEKKLKLLRLRRTSEQISAIMKRNLITTNYRVITSDCNFWTQGLRKKYDEESVRIWKGKRFVKINGSFTPYTRWFYHNYIEPVPKGWIVYHLDCDKLNDEPDNLACRPRTGLTSFERYLNALPLLVAREEKILLQLPKMNYDKHKSEIKQMHSDLNRIRKLQEKINFILNTRDMYEKAKQNNCLSFTI
jgi:hypothetical protein